MHFPRQNYGFIAKARPAVEAKVSIPFIREPMRLFIREQNLIAGNNLNGVQLRIPYPTNTRLCARM
jgi:hypothetical protein